MVNIEITYPQKDNLKMEPVLARIIKSFTAKDLDCSYDKKQNKLVHYIIND